MIGCETQYWLRRNSYMQRDVLLVSEMIEAAEVARTMG